MPKKKPNECEKCDLAGDCKQIPFKTVSDNCEYYTPKSCPPERRAILKERMNHGD
ncbi:MAG: hypothetical protein L0956_10225 [Candidatus Mariimomonas ferrooxydans]